MIKSASVTEFTYQCEKYTSSRGVSSQCLNACVYTDKLDWKIEGMITELSRLAINISHKKMCWLQVTDGLVS